MERPHNGQRIVRIVPPLLLLPPPLALLAAPGACFICDDADVDLAPAFTCVVDVGVETSTFITGVGDLADKRPFNWSER